MYRQKSTVAANAQYSASASYVLYLEAKMGSNIIYGILNSESMVSHQVFKSFDNVCKL